MLGGRKVVVVMPAYNSAATLRRTVAEIDSNVVDEIILVDDASHDDTVMIARSLGLRCHVHDHNAGYGANQKTCYRIALEAGAEIVVMVHPDYQYSPKLIGAMAAMVASGIYDVVIGSRILGRGARVGGMPLYKYVANRLLTAFQNIAFSMKFSEYHTGLRAFSSKALLSLPLEENGDDFIFDNQMMAQLVYFDFNIGEISCPTRYFPEASSISFWRSVRYGLGVIKTTYQFLLAKCRITRVAIFDPGGAKLITKELGGGRGFSLLSL